MDYKLIIFDLDGTLAERQGDILPGVREWFANHKELHNFAIATNQGGVGLRYWMEKDGFGDPSKYPTEDEVWAHLARVCGQLDDQMRCFVSFAYQAKSGNWSPVPDRGIDPEQWKRDSRKPAPGMLLDAMRSYDATVSKTLMVGDSEEDQQAAQAAGCAFQWAKDFFSRDQ